MSLAVLADCLEALERPAEALERPAEALERPAEALASNAEASEQLRPFFLRVPQAAIQWMRPMHQQYAERCKQAQIETDSDLLGPIMEVFEKLQAPDADS